MLHFVKEYEYPKYVEYRIAFGQFLKKEKEWDDEVMTMLNFFMKAERVIAERLNDFHSIEEYFAWCKSFEVYTLLIMADQYDKNSRKREELFHQRVNDAVTQLKYLLSEKCVENFKKE